MSERSAIIVGAGIGGLTASLMLARIGMKVTLLEQATAFGEVGAGIQISPNASRVLFALGLEKPLSERAFFPKGVEMRTWREGRNLVEIPIGAEVEKKFGAPYLHLHRADLHAVLAEAAQTTQGIESHLGAGCERVEQTSTGVTAITTDGRRFEADMLIGADGINSVVREALFGPESPRFTGCVAWRGMVPAEAVRKADVHPVASNWMGPNAHFVHYYVRAGNFVNFVAVVEKDGWDVESWTERGEKSELVDDFAGWHPTVVALIEASDPETCYKWALFDRDPLERWSQGRITLLGDACHPTLPFMAQGACMAIEDAAVLAGCLERSAAESPAEEPDIAAAFLRYESLRKERTAGVQLGSRNNKNLYHLSGPKAWIRNLGMALFPGGLASRVEALYEYDALTAANG